MAYSWYSGGGFDRKAHPTSSGRQDFRWHHETAWYQSCHNPQLQSDVRLAVTWFHWDSVIGLNTRRTGVIWGQRLFFFYYYFLWQGHRSTALMFETWSSSSKWLRMYSSGIWSRQTTGGTQSISTWLLDRIFPLLNESLDACLQFRVWNICTIGEQSLTCLILEISKEVCMKRD